MENVNKQFLERLLAFSKAMQKSGNELPRYVIAETEQASTAAEQAQQAVPDGYALVPRKLQPEQRAAILAWARENSQSNSWPEKAYEIAIAAAPMLAAAQNVE